MNIRKCCVIVLVENSHLANTDSSMIHPFFSSKLLHQDFQKYCMKVGIHESGPPFLFSVSNFENLSLMLCCLEK